MRAVRGLCLYHVAIDAPFSRIDGSPLRYNQADPYLPDLLVCNPSLVDSVLAVTKA